MNDSPTESTATCRAACWCGSVLSVAPLRFNRDGSHSLTPGCITSTVLTAEGQITVSHIAPFAPGGRTRAIRMVPTHAAAHRSLRNCSRITPVSVGLSFSVSGVMLRPGAM